MDEETPRPDSEDVRPENRMMYVVNVHPRIELDNSWMPLDAITEQSDEVSRETFRDEIDEIGASSEVTNALSTEAGSGRYSLFG